MQAPPQAPVRNMIEVPQPPNAFDPRAPKATFKVMTYNCLADIYATPQVCWAVNTFEKSHSACGWVIFANVNFRKCRVHPMCAHTGLAWVMLPASLPDALASPR